MEAISKLLHSKIKLRNKERSRDKGRENREDSREKGRESREETGKAEINTRVWL